MQEVWCVFECEPGRDEMAKRNLEEQGFTVFQPYFTRKIRHARKTIEVKKPLFFNYGFVKVDMETKAWRSIMGTRGVSHLLLGSNQRPGTVPETGPNSMEALRKIAAEYCEDMASKPLLTPGQVIKFIGGALAQAHGPREAVVVSSTEETVEAEFPILGHATKITVPRDHVEAA